MRPIKFRAWDDYDQKLYYLGGGKLELTNDFTTGEVMIYRNAHRLEPEQFTGLLDKNGKEIYEGDIVKDQKKQPNIGQVFWHEASFRIEWKMRSYDGTRPVEVCTDDCFGYAEVIGNFHENPELLK